MVEPVTIADVRGLSPQEYVRHREQADRIVAAWHAGQAADEAPPQETTLSGDGDAGKGADPGRSGGPCSVEDVRDLSPREYVLHREACDRIVADHHR